MTNEKLSTGTVRNVIQEQIAKGGGVFCFSGSSASSSSSETSSAKVQQTSEGITIKFPGPQILGYYLEKTPPDESRYLTSGKSEGDISKDDMSVEEFIESCKQMMETLQQSRENVKGGTVL